MVDYSEDVRACSAVLRTGGIILYPTDTIWGLGCDARDEAAVERIIALKKRPAEKSFIVLLAEAKDVLQYVAAPPPDVQELIESFSTPTTLIFEGGLALAPSCLGDDGSVAIRIPRDPFCKALIKRIGAPLVSTSANFSGAPSAATYHQIDHGIREGVDYVVQYRREDETVRPPSRILRVGGGGTIRIIRP
jgi:L-threonylcarbamoyladenylate synthase